MLAMLRWHMSAMCRAAAWAVQCLQIFARTGQGQSATVSDPSPAWPTGVGAGDTHCSLCWCRWWHWDLIVSRSPGYQRRCPLAPGLTLYFPALPHIIPGSGSVTCCVCLAWAGECTRTRSVTESEMKWYNTSCWILYQPASATGLSQSEAKQFYWTWIIFHSLWLYSKAIIIHDRFYEYIAFFFQLVFFYPWCNYDSLSSLVRSSLPCPPSLCLYVALSLKREKNEAKVFLVWANNFEDLKWDWKLTERDSGQENVFKYQLQFRVHLNSRIFEIWQ